MNFIHLVEDENGISYFTDVEIDFQLADFAPPAPAMYMSDSKEAARYLFLILPAGWNDAQHPSPRRQIAFCLSGEMLVTAGNGEERPVKPGGIWLMEDITGEGHASRVVGTENAHLAIVQLD